MPRTTDPLVVEVLRGDQPDSIHRVVAAVVDIRGTIIRSWGRPGDPIFPHSALKLIKAIPLLETGASDRFGLTTEEIVLACSSHVGEHDQIEKIANWLRRIGLSEGHLACGAMAPFSSRAVDALRRAGRPCTQLHNNNSGTHAGFLTTALHVGEDISGYVSANHPVQHRVRRTLESMIDMEMSQLPSGTDNCGVPAYAIPIYNLALAMARMAEPAQLNEARRNAISRIFNAIRLHPSLLVGPGRLSTVIVEITDGAVIVKGGSEGIFFASVPFLGLGVALKAEDGSQRAADVALLAVLSHVGAFKPSQTTALADRMQPPRRNPRGEYIGKIRCQLG
jgi:L-asparaginase II